MPHEVDLGDFIDLFRMIINEYSNHNCLNKYYYLILYDIMMYISFKKCNFPSIYPKKTTLALSTGYQKRGKRTD